MNGREIGELVVPNSSNQLIGDGSVAKPLYDAVMKVFGTEFYCHKRAFMPSYSSQSIITDSILSRDGTFTKVDVWTMQEAENPLR